MQPEKDYDIIIIGAGIQGAGVAQAATICGYKTLVIEKFPHPGMGTSSKSSKLIHGGLRYLESGQLKLVKECLNERKYLLKNASKLVKQLPFYIPVYSHSSRSGWMVGLGMIIYSLLSMKPFSIIRKKQWHNLDGIRKDNLRHVFKYYDAQTDDKKLTRAVIESAIKFGAEIKYNTIFLESKYKNNFHHITYSIAGKNYHTSCQTIINCSGPWVEKVQKNIHPDLTLPPIDLVAGTHIIIKHELTQGAYYLEAADQRAVFVTPWKQHSTLIGTTERKYNDAVDNITATDEEITYLIDVFNQNFDKKISHEDISSIFCGLRVLPSSNKSESKKPRESLIIQSTTVPGQITLVGGKLTAYRSSAEQIINIVKKLQPKKTSTSNCNTKETPLT